jgi:hypothetical protein
MASGNPGAIFFKIKIYLLVSLLIANKPMKAFLILSFAFSVIACTSSTNKEVVQGKLEDFVSSEVSFERDIESGYLSFQEPIFYRGREAVYTKWNGRLHFYDPTSGRKISTFQIPTEGPNAMKGSAEIAKVFENDLVMATNATGLTHIYRDGSLSNSFTRDIQSYEPKGYLYFPDNQNALHQIAPNQFEITFNPFNPMGFREGKDGLDLEFRSWVGVFDQNGDWICKSNLKAPYDDTYRNSAQGGKLVRMVDKGNSWLMFPYSDSLYQIKNCEIIRRLKLESKSRVQYLPEKFEGDARSGTWTRPADGALNSYLFRDLHSNNYIRLVHLKEKRDQPEITDIRKRLFLNEVTYLLLVYDLDWNLKAELEMTYPAGSRFENLFTTSQGLFINKPEQKSEDEYEFYKIDLSRLQY